MNTREKRERGIIKSIRKGVNTSTAIMSDNTSLYPSVGVVRELLKDLSDQGEIKKVQVGFNEFVYELAEKHSLPWPVHVPHTVHQIGAIYE